MNLRAALTALGLAACAGAISCGGAAPPPQPAPSVPMEGAPASPAGELEDALAELDAAERRLAEVLGGVSAGSAEALGSTGGAAKKKPDAGDTQASLPPTAPRPDATPTSEQDPCAIACSALASMKRAADRLCGLTGEGDERCSGARGRVGSAVERVRASCPACG